jgi:hypothetical protein
MKDLQLDATAMPGRAFDHSFEMPFDLPEVDILAIPPRVDEGNACCKWRFTMREQDDPEYVPVELGPKPH